MSSNKFLFSFGIVGFSLFDVGFCGSNTVCDAAWGCYDDTIDSENVYCRGYAACYGADITAEEYTVMTGGYTGLYADITAEYNAYCYGLYACLDTTMEITNDFYNYGFASCAYSDVNIGDDYYSRGMYSGYDLTIDGEDYSYIHGFLGGAFSTMKDFLRTYNLGYFSLYYADVYSPGNATETVYFVSYGYYAAYYTDFYCQGDDTCKIYCDSTGCSELTVYVEDTASYSTSCSSSCAECPTIESYSSMAELKQTTKYKQRQLLRKERAEWFDAQLGLKNGVNKIETFVKETSQIAVKTNSDNTYHKTIYEATSQARKQKNDIINKILAYHQLSSDEGNSSNSSLSSSSNAMSSAQLSLGLSVVNSIETTHANHGKFFNIDIISFIVGIGATLTLGVTSQYGISKMQQK